MKPPIAPAPARITAGLMVLFALTACAGPAENTGSTSPSSSASAASSPGLDSDAEAQAAFQARVDTLAAVDRTNPDRVAAAFTELITSWNTITDGTETAADTRAEPLMVPELAERTVEPERNASQALWLELQPFSAVSVPTLGEGVPSDADEGTDSADIAYRNFRVTWSWQSSEGKKVRDDARTRNVFLVLTRSGGQWLVADYVTEDLPA